jgi:hypothetical protein
LKKLKISFSESNGFDFKQIALGIEASTVYCGKPDRAEGGETPNKKSTSVN